LPEPDNRVTLDPAASDMYGVPRIAHRLGPYIEAGLAAARDAHSKIFAAMGATEVQHRDTAEGAGHIMGTARMGNDPKDSVVDRDLRSHDHPNLFVLGSAVFPTGSAANPTLTIAALSLRAVDLKATLTQ
jgi:choline dehydrogenase-like flavoprotein